MEDDIFVKDPGVFDHYVEPVGITGIQHLNFSKHDLRNRTSTGILNPVIIVDYGPLRIALLRQ